MSVKTEVNPTGSASLSAKQRENTERNAERQPRVRGHYVEEQMPNRGDIRIELVSVYKHAVAAALGMKTRTVWERQREVARLVRDQPEPLIETTSWFEPACNELFG